MLNTATALYDFYSQFGLPAYTTDNVPDDAKLPYLTYWFYDSDWDTPATHYVQIYMRTNSNVELLTKADEIKDAIGTGKSILCGDGYVVLHYENAQILTDDENDVRSVYISMQIDCLHT